MHFATMLRMVQIMSENEIHDFWQILLQIYNKSVTGDLSIYYAIQKTAKTSLYRGGHKNISKFNYNKLLET